MNHSLKGGNIMRSYQEMKETKYDVIIVGAGPAGIFTAYELMEKAKDYKVL